MYILAFLNTILMQKVNRICKEIGIRAVIFENTCPTRQCKRVIEQHGVHEEA